jgi:hypothetical protein
MNVLVLDLKHVYGGVSVSTSLSSCDLSQFLMTSFLRGEKSLTDCDKDDCKISTLHCCLTRKIGCSTNLESRANILNMGGGWC